MARTSTEFTQAERNAFEAFFLKNHLVFDGEVGEKNGEILADFIANKMNADITTETLTAAVKVVKGLVFKTAAQREFDAAILGMSEAEKSVVGKWLERQKQLVLDGDSGLENFSIIVGWLRARNYPISEANLNVALTNVLNSGRRHLYWKAAPPADRTVVGGKINHALTAPTTPVKPNEPEPEYRGGRLNHASTPHHAPPPTAASSNSQWQARAESVRGNRHSETAAIKRMFVNGPNGEIDWRATYAARDRAASR